MTHVCVMSDEESASDEYITVRLPKNLMDEVDSLIKRRIRGYKSRAEFIKETVRKRLEELKAAEPELRLPPLEHYNLDDQGVRILDRTLTSQTSKGRIIDVYFKPNSVWCDYDQSDNCQHVKFALDIPGVQEILNRKGWTVKK